VTVTRDREGRRSRSRSVRVLSSNRNPWEVPSVKRELLVMYQPSWLVNRIYFAIVKFDCFRTKIVLASVTQNYDAIAKRLALCKTQYACASLLRVGLMRLDDELPLMMFTSFFRRLGHYCSLIRTRACQTSRIQAERQGAACGHFLSPYSTL